MVLKRLDYDVVNIGTTNERKRSIISEYNGRFVFVKDSNMFPYYLFGKIKFSRSDEEVYSFKSNGGRGVKLRFSDLEGLLVPVNKLP